MYQEYFHLHGRPFAITPDPRYLFLSERHREALAHLLYGVRVSGGFVQLTGEVGTGKTTVCRALLEQLPEDVDVALILNPRLSSLELVATLCDELGVDYPRDVASIKTLTDCLNRHLLENHARGRRTVVIIDEAQNLGADVLEQVRLLTNLETAEHKLLQIILVGQPELRDLLGRRDLRQLAQRITARYHLGALSAAETRAYVEHRLAVAGADPRQGLFTRAALNQVYRLTGGIPRLVNILCDRALLGAYSANRPRVNPTIVRRAAAEVLPHAGTTAGSRRARPVWGLGMALAILALSLLLLRQSAWHPPPAAQTSRTRAPEVAAGRGQEPRTLAVPPAPTGKTATAVSPAQETGGARPPRAVSPTVPVPAAGAASLSARAAPAAPVAPPPTPRLARLLAGTDAEGGSLLAWQALFRLWQVPLLLNDPLDPCRQAAAAGLRCYHYRGTLAQLRRLDRPAIVWLERADGQRIPCLLRGLDDGRVRMQVAGKAVSLPLDQLTAAWDGEFILLWRPPVQVSRLRLGDQGPAVGWLRQHLAASGLPLAATGDRFDPPLEAAVRRFQAAQGLRVDGVAGPETLIRLNLRVVGEKGPRLLDRAARRHQGA